MRGEKLFLSDARLDVRLSDVRLSDIRRQTIRRMLNF